MALEDRNSTRGLGLWPIPLGGRDGNEDSLNSLVESLNEGSRCNHHGECSNPRQQVCHELGGMLADSLSDQSLCSSSLLLYRCPLDWIGDSDTARLGLSFVPLWPSRETTEYQRQRTDLKPEYLGNLRYHGETAIREDVHVTS